MTILGLHTIAETRDLMRSLEFRINKNVQQLQRIQMQRLQPQTATQTQLDTDMGTFVKRWVDVRDTQALIMAAAMAANPGIIPQILPAEKQFQAIVNASSVDDPRLKVIEASIDAEAASLGLPPTDLSGQPAQNSPDADFLALKKLDTAITAAQTVAGNAAKSNTGLLIGAGIVGVLGIVIVTKVYL